MIFQNMQVLKEKFFYRIIITDIPISSNLRNQDRNIFSEEYIVEFISFHKYSSSSFDAERALCQKNL